MVEKPFEPGFRSRVEYRDALARWYADAGRFPDLAEAYRAGKEGAEDAV